MNEPAVSMDLYNCLSVGNIKLPNLQLNDKCRSIRIILNPFCVICAKTISVLIFKVLQNNPFHDNKHFKVNSYCVLNINFGLSI